MRKTKKYIKDFTITKFKEGDNLWKQSLQKVLMHGDKLK